MHSKSRDRAVGSSSGSKNDEDWKPEYGGELVIYKDDHGVILYPTKGRVVIIESQLLEHEVKPVIKPRYSITGWLRTRKL